MSDNSYAHKKYFAYRHAYANRHQVTPKGRRKQKRYTWAQWFEDTFHEPIEQYHQRVMQRKKNNESQKLPT